MEIDESGNRYFISFFVQTWTRLLLIAVARVYSEPYQRTSDDIKSMIKLAKLNEKNLTELTQAIYYGVSDSEGSKYKLLELNGHLLTAIEEGQTLQFKGGLNEKVVLCSDTKTFEIKEAGISNSLLVVPELKHGQATSTSPLKSPKNAANSSLDKSANTSSDSIEDEDLLVQRHQESREVKEIFHEYFECREVKPKFRKLGDLLQLTRYSGPENEHFIDRSLQFTFKQLLNTTQCSREEFENGLRVFRALPIDGRIRVLDIEYEYRLLSLMLGIVTENSWPLDRIDREETLASISETIAPPQIVSSLFDIYTAPGSSEGPSSSTKTFYVYDNEMVCRTIALNILQQGTKFHLQDFMDTWQSALPDGMTIDVCEMRGVLETRLNPLLFLFLTFHRRATYVASELLTETLQVCRTYVR